MRKLPRLFVIGAMRHECAIAIGLKGSNFKLVFSCVQQTISGISRGLKLQNESENDCIN